MVKKIDNAVYQIVKDLVEKKFQGGIHVYGLDNDGIGYAMDENNEPLIPKNVIDTVEASKKKIIDGQIKVTNAMEK
jgi:basic membrane protein A